MKLKELKELDDYYDDYEVVFRDNYHFEELEINNGIDIDDRKKKIKLIR